jgi:hypothetical protein
MKLSVFVKFEQEFTVLQPACPGGHDGGNKHDYKHKGISKEAQEDQVQFRVRNSRDQAGNVRMTEDMTT